MKNKYVVYAQDKVENGNGDVSYSKKILLGTTFAISEKKAISNIKFRLGIKANQLCCDYAYGGYRETILTAEIA